MVRFLIVYYLSMASCMEYAMNYLSRYPKTEQEMKLLLYKKGYDSESIQKTMNVLKQNNFVNDEKYAESYFYSEVIKKGKPVFVIKQKLLQRWIDKEILNKLIEESKDDISQGIASGIEREISAYKKKWVEGFDIIQKLMRKGYRLQDIKDVLQTRTW